MTTGTTGTIVILHPNGRMIEALCKDGPPPRADVEALVRGPVRVVTVNAYWRGEPAQVICNQNAETKKMALNKWAMDYLHPDVEDDLAGPVVLLVGEARW